MSLKTVQNVSNRNSDYSNLIKVIHCSLQNALHLVRYNWYMVTGQMGMREEWRFALEDSGGQCVITHGITTMPKLFVGNLGLEQLVNLPPQM